LNSIEFHYCQFKCLFSALTRAIIPITLVPASPHFRSQNPSPQHQAIMSGNLEPVYMRCSGLGQWSQSSAVSCSICDERAPNEIFIARQHTDNARPTGDSCDDHCVPATQDNLLTLSRRLDRVTGGGQMRSLNYWMIRNL